METCGKEKIFSLDKLECIDNTLSARTINNKIYSGDPLSPNKIRGLEFLDQGAYGSVYKACFPNIEGKCKFLLVEKKTLLKLPKKMLEEVKKDKKYLIKYKDSFTELYVMFVCNRILEQKITQNLPYLYGYNINNSLLSFVSEFANGGDFKNWLLEKKRTKKQLHNAYFQIFHGLYSIFKYAKVYHNDLHWKNILVFNVKKGGVFEYKINKKQYYLSNNGFIFVLWDFGFAKSTMPGDLSGLIEDTTRISYVPVWENETTGKNTYGKEQFNYATRDKNISSMEDIFIPFKDLTTKPKGKIIDTFNS